MADFECTRCKVTVHDPPASKAKPPCPKCGWGMVPKPGPAAGEIDFPKEAKKESILNMPLPEDLKDLHGKKSN